MSNQMEMFCKYVDWRDSVCGKRPMVKFERIVIHGATCGARFQQECSCSEKKNMMVEYRCQSHCDEFWRRASVGRRWTREILPSPEIT